MSLRVLKEAGRSPSLPFSVVLNDQLLVVDRWLRVLPGKRYVGRATYNDRPVLVKLFVGARAQDKARSEVRGIKLLSQHQLPTPQLLSQGSDSGGAWVMTQWLDDAQTLSDLADISIEGLSSLECCPESVLGVAHLISSMHQSHVIQNDIHPANFIYSNNRWWVVDASDVEVGDEGAVESNFGVFLAQLPRQWIDLVVSAYFGSGVVDESVCDRILKVCDQWRSWRAEDLAAKSLRDCSLFDVEQQFNRFDSRWRSEALQLAEPDLCLETGKLLKDGGSATVGLIEWGNRVAVMKRYNLKGWLHWLKRFWRPTRAWHSWWVSHRLRVLGVPTPRSIALREERFGPFRGRGYLLAEQCLGCSLTDACQDEAVTKAVALQLAGVLNIFIREKITHGDFKATNLLWDGSLHLIDLDAVQWHRSEVKWKKAFEKDMRRLLRNWPEGSMQHGVMSSMINELKY